MRKTAIFISLLLTMGGVFGEELKAENIMLQDMYAISPIDDSTETGNVGDAGIETKGKSDNPNYIIAHTEGGSVVVDFGAPAGSVQVIISRGDGSIFRQHSELNPQNITVDMSGATAGQYLLEVYTDTEALGGVFEVK